MVFIFREKTWRPDVANMKHRQSPPPAVISSYPVDSGKMLEWRKEQSIARCWMLSACYTLTYASQMATWVNYMLAFLLYRWEGSARLNYSAGSTFKQCFQDSTVCKITSCARPPRYPPSHAGKRGLSMLHFWQKHGGHWVVCVPTVKSQSPAGCPWRELSWKSEVQSGLTSWIFFLVEVADGSIQS